MDYLGWRTVFTETLQRLVRGATEFAPSLLGAILLLAFGWLVARLARAFVDRLLAAGLRRLAHVPSLESAVHRTRLQATLPWAIGALLYWVILLFFLSAAVEHLGLPAATALVGRLAAYLPNVILGLVLVFTGIVTGSMAHSAILRAGAAAGMSQAPVLGRMAEILVIFVGVVIGIDQVGIHSTLLMLVVTVVVATVLGGVGLAFGLGSHSAVSNLISSRHVSKSYRVGQTVGIDGVEGRILEITSTGVVLEAKEGRVLVPAQKFSHQVSVLMAGLESS